MIHFLFIPLQMCAFGLWFVTRFVSLFIESTPDEGADSTTMADWQFYELQDHAYVSFMMNHVATMKANLSSMHAELTVSPVVKLRYT